MRRIIRKSPRWKVIVGDTRKVLGDLPDATFRTCITSPPYWNLRDYGVNGQIGNETTIDEYVHSLVVVMRDVRRVLTDDGTLWLNIGDAYAGSKKGHVPDEMKAKDLMGLPWEVAIALRKDGWWLRQDIIWHKPNPAPEPVRDRCTRSHEYLFMLSKNARYHYDIEPIREPIKETNKGVLGGVTPKAGGTMFDGDGRPLQQPRKYDTIKGANKRDVWSVSTKPYKGAHFAVMPEALVEPCILAASVKGDNILDPFAGSGTVGVVAKRLGRKFVGVELNTEYAALAKERISNA